MLGYTRWENFQTAVRRAKTACGKAEENPADHFHGTTKIVEAGATSKPIEDIELTRFACYLIAQNGDPTKPQIAAAQTYFAVQTRRQETADKKQAAQHAELRSASIENFKNFHGRLSRETTAWVYALGTMLSGCYVGSGGFDFFNFHFRIPS
mgnify:CR=1 FL=1